MNNRVVIGQVTPLIESYFAQATTFFGTSRTRFANSVGVNPAVIWKACAREAWVQRQEQWKNKRDEQLLGTIRLVMNELIQTARSRAEFTTTLIVRRVKEQNPKIEISKAHFDRLAIDEWRSMAATLPSAGDVRRDRMLRKLQELVDANIPANELSLKRLRKETGEMVQNGPWIAGPLRAAHALLAERQRNADVTPPAGPNIRIIPGGWIDLDSEVWNFKAGKTCVRRDALRADIAEVVWPELREAVRQAERSLTTIHNRFRNYLAVGKLFGADVRYVPAAKLEDVQRAWASGRAKTKTNVPMLRSLLTHLFTSLFNLSKDDPDINRKEMLKIVLWLRTQVKLPQKQTNKDFLTAAELDAVLSCCIRDIEAGFSFLATEPQLLSLSTLARATPTARPVLHLTAALIILAYAFSGLRRSSATDLEVGDSMRIRPRLSALVWRHNKKREENIVLAPAVVTTLLEHYIYRTNEVRQSLKTNRIFLAGDWYGGWAAIKSGYVVTEYMDNFVRRHNLTRDRKPLRLTATILRRTYATQQLYKGRSIYFVRAQFGHRSIKSTQGYVQLDRYEHPAQVRSALDEWGQRVLALWDKPVLVDHLESTDRAAVFGAAGPADEDEAIRTDTLACVTCENLVSGPEFIDEWEGEHERREGRLRAMEDDPDSHHLLESERLEHRLFLDNYNRFKGGLTEDD